mmetsp:Transcript_11262/g.37224  ORF Transcript_11262/g.37224 Transcript_11262/m.37224 type:complete len:236 (+) Transcript_11262:111-818(+)
MVAKMSISLTTMYSIPSVSYILSPAYLKNITLSPFLIVIGTSSPSSPFFPGPAAMTVAVLGRSMAPSVSMMPPADVLLTSMGLIRIRSPRGCILGMSAAVAPLPGNVPIKSCSLITMYESSFISKSVHPMPNLLYSTVLPFSREMHSGPSSMTSPEVGFRCAVSARMIPPAVLVSASAILTKTRSAVGAIFLYCLGISNPFAARMATSRLEETRRPGAVAAAEKATVETSEKAMS